MRRGELLRELEQSGLPERLTPVYGKDAPGAAYRNQWSIAIHQPTGEVTGR